MINPASFTYPPEIQSLLLIRKDLQGVAGNWELPGTELHQLGLIIEELFSFIIKRLAGNGVTDPVSVQLSIHGRYVDVRLAYGGPALNPMEPLKPDFFGGLEQDDEGEMGLELVKTIAETVCFVRENGTNRLEVRKEIKKPKKSEYHD